MPNLDKLIVMQSASIRDAVKVVNDGKLQVAFVVNDGRQLVGSVTDGDVRRAIINGCSLQDPVLNIMNTNPVYLRSKTEAVEAKLRRTAYHSIPVVDDDMCVIDVVISSAIANYEGYTNPVVLMAGGLGTRLRPFTDDCPKPLLNVGEKPLLDTILSSLVEQGFSQYYISVNYLSEKLKSYFGDGDDRGVSISYLEEEKRLGTVGALSLLPPGLDKPILVVNGDVLTKVSFSNLMQFHNNNESDISVCVTHYEHQVPYGVIDVDDGKIKGLVEKPVNSYLINAGIYVVNPRIISLIPKDTFYDMTTLLEACISKGMSVAVYPITEYWLDIGRSSEYAKANWDYKNHF
jgi:dTDP-glucose pyrophosphorylase